MGIFNKLGFMNITINTDVLRRHNLSLGEFLIMLLGYFDIDVKECQNNIIEKHFAERNLFKDIGTILSNNSKDLVAQILMESDERVIRSGIDFTGLAERLQSCYPSGIKSGTTYSWRGDTEVIAQKLRTLVAVYGFTFTEDEAINAVKTYLESFKTPCKDTLILKNFILRTRRDSDGKAEMESLFMTTVENNRL